MAQASKLFDLSQRSALASPPRAPQASPRPTEPSRRDLNARDLNARDLGVYDEAPRPEGPRKLVRPQLPAHLSRPAQAPRRLRGSAPLAAHQGAPSTLHQPAGAPASHAEALYFQKQMQAQTPMVFVLEDGEQLQGTVEWFDRDTIKVRNETRTLIYKRTIKYLYKASGDHHP